jgi:SSS family solute:Na+ symporter
MAFYFVGASLFASNVGSEHFVGQAGDGARRGIAVALYEWYATILLIALGWLFAPVFARAGIYTTPEFLERRFNKHCRTYLSVITCVMYVVTKMSASIYGGAVILSSAMGWNLYVAAGACILLSALYTITGGLRAVMYTDLIQMIVFVGGGLVVMVATLDKVPCLLSLPPPLPPPRHPKSILGTPPNLHQPEPET